MSPERIGDLEPKDRIRISRDEKGVITLQVVQFDRAGLKGVAVVRFSKDGHSPQTYEALSNLIEAVEKDNQRGNFLAADFETPWLETPE